MIKNLTYPTETIFLFVILCCFKFVFMCITLFRIVASRIRYEITGGNLGGAFAVKNMTGAIYVAGPLDYETRKRVSDKITISDITHQSI